jgi:hypothetical protein
MRRSSRILRSSASSSKRPRVSNKVQSKTKQRKLGRGVKSKKTAVTIASTTSNTTTTTSSSSTSTSSLPSKSTSISIKVAIDPLKQDDLVWISCPGSGSQIGKVRTTPSIQQQQNGSGYYRVNFYGTKTFEYVKRNQLQKFDVATVPSCLHEKCDGDSEAYRSVYYALESLHRKKLLVVPDIPSNIWSILNQHLNEEESSDSDTSDDEDNGNDSDSSLSCASDDDRIAPKDADGRFRRFRSCLEDPKLALAKTPREKSKTSSGGGSNGALRRSSRKKSGGSSNDNLRANQSLLNQYASPRPGTMARAVYGVDNPEDLSSLLEFDANDDQSWLSGAFIDYIFGIFARKYKGLRYLPTVFAAHELKRAVASELENLRITDVLGVSVNPKKVKRLVFCFNVNDNHWTMLHIVVGNRQKKELHVFEPMGLPQSRRTKTSNTQYNNRGGNGNNGMGSNNGVSSRNFPRRLLQWLEAVWPTKGEQQSWGELAVSAIKRRQQLTGFDCGVACLLYAEKCGIGMDRLYIARSTSQRHITAYRHLLQKLMDSALNQ